LTWWLSKTIIVVVGPVWNLEGIKEFSEWHVDTLCAFGEVGKSIVSLLLGKNDFVASSFVKITLILPLVICFLLLSIALPQAWTLFSYKVIEEALGSQIFEITNGNLIIVRNTVRLLSCVFAKEIPKTSLIEYILTDVVVD
jgi:hypothetical protein